MHNTEQSAIKNKVLYEKIAASKARQQEDGGTVDGVPIDLHGEDWSNFSFPERMWLANGNLTDTDLTGAVLPAVQCESAQMLRTTFTSAQARDGNFQRATLRGAVFDVADVSGSTFENADVSNASFARATVRGANFRNADILGATFRDADLTDANLSEAKGLSLAWSAPHSSAHREELRVTSARYTAGLRMPSAECGAWVL